MQRTYRVPLARAGLVALVAITALLAHPGTSIAGGASESLRGSTEQTLQRGAGYYSAGQHGRVRELQRRLQTLGWRPGRVDGLFGPRTEAAVIRMQAAAGLMPDGIVGPQTRRALRLLRAGRLRRGAGYTAPQGSDRVRRLQRELRQRGLDPGPVDGRFGPQTERAVARLQQRAELPAHGVVDRVTDKLLAQVPERRAGNGSTAGPRPADRRPSTPSASPVAIDSPGATDGIALGAVVVGAGLVLMVGAVAGLLLARTRLARSEVARPVSLEEPSDVPHAEVETPVVTVPRPTQTETAAPMQATPGVRTLGYASIPESARDEAIRLGEQAAEIDSLCEQRGWQLLEVVHDKDNGNGKALERPGMQYALDRIARGEATCLLVPRLERLSRSLPDLARVIEAVRCTGGRLVVADLPLDTATSQGRLAAETLVSIGEWERRRLGERTRKGLEAARARRSTTGRAAVDDLPELKERIVAMRAEGMTLQAIADRLNAERVPTVRGGKQWRPSSVQAAAGYRRPRQPRGGEN